MLEYVPTRGAMLPAALCLAGLLAGQAQAQKQREVLIATKKADVYRLAFSPDGKTLAYSVADRFNAPAHVVLCDVETGKETGRFELAHKGYLSRLLAFTPDGKSILTSAVSNTTGVKGFNLSTLEVWDVGKRELRSHFRLEEGDGARMVVANDGKTFVVASKIGPPVGAVYDLADKRRCNVLLNGKQPAEAFSLSGDDRWLATWHRPNFVSVWDFQKRGEVRCFEAQKGVRAIALSPRGDRVVTTGGSCELIVWDAQKGKELARYKHPRRTTSRYHFVAFGPEGKTVIAAGDFFGTGIVVWDPATGAVADESNELGEDSDELVVLSADRRMLATYRQLQGIRFWDLPSVEEVNKRKK